MTGALHLAQFNIARIRYPLDDPRMRQFTESVERINGLAENIPGFVWRLQDASGHAMHMTIYDDPAILPNLTVWESAGALERFVWKTAHNRFYRRRDEWFAQAEPTLAMWWAPVGHRPSLQEGVARLDHLKAYGPSDFAFGWEQLAGARHWKTARGTRSERAA